MSYIFKAAIAALVLATTAAPAAFAQAGAETTSIRVAYGDLNLASKAGAKTLLWRMRSATVKVCGAKPSPRLIAASMRHRVCAQDAMARAVRDVDAPMLTALFTGEAVALIATR